MYSNFKNDDYKLSVVMLLAQRKRFPDDPAYAKFVTLEKLVKAGKLGRKTGEGFYKYNK